MSVSYANIAATGTPSDSQPAAPVTEPAASPEVSPQSPPVDDKPAEKPEVVAKKTLAPAPVPTKAVWGAPVAQPMAVDEHKWPTPDKLVKHNLEPAKGQQKFIKPVTNKWVPIPAKVTLASPHTGAQKQRNRKKRQGQSQPQNPASAHTVVPPVPAQLAGSSPPAAQVSPAHSASPDDDKNNGHKNFRRFNGSPQFKGRFSPQQQFFPPQNGFYHPQPYQNVPGFPRGQFRPRGGAHGLPVINGFVPPFANGIGYPHPQIPPPISPKQDPLEALTQQIDYYFSLENLIKDIFLRKHMHDQDGWVPLTFILDFKRVKIILNGIQNSSELAHVDQDAVVLASLDQCCNLDVKYVNGKEKESASVGDIQLRVKDNYKQWLLPEA